MTCASNLRDQRERREIIRTRNQPASSFFQEAVKGRSLEGGNYEAQRDLVITGEGVYQVPRLPASSPWSVEGPQVPIEPPLGAACDEMDPWGPVSKSKGPSMR